ncbi:MAG: DNA polymerase III subunit delta [Oligoflexales bacterium]
MPSNTGLHQPAIQKRQTTMAKRDPSPLYSEYVQQLKGAFGRTTPLLLWGPSGYLHHKAILALEKNKPSQVDFQFHDPQGLAPNFLTEQLSQSDMFGHSQWVVIRRGESDRSFHKKIKNLKIHPSNNLIISHQSAQLPKNISKVFDTFHHIPCFDPKPIDMPKFTCALAKSLGFELTLDQAESLLAMTGENLDTIDNELQILSLAYHGQQTNTARLENLTEHIKKQKEESCFRITDFLIRGDIARAFIHLEALLQQGEAPLALLGILAKHCRTTLAFQEGLLPQGYIPRTQQQLYRSYARKLPKKSCREALLKCGLADRQLKSSTTPPHLVLSQIIWELNTHSMLK